jgi:hypothetical protein
VVPYIVLSKRRLLVGAYSFLESWVQISIKKNRKLVINNLKFTLIIKIRTSLNFSWWKLTQVMKEC